VFEAHAQLGPCGFQEKFFAPFQDDDGGLGEDVFQAQGF
jgi:hypothetical protein